MRVKIKCIDIKVGEVFQQYLADKLYRLGEKYEITGDADVILKLVKNNKDRNKLIEVRIAISGPDIFVKAQEEGFELASKKVLSALNSKLKKYKEVDLGHPVNNPLKI